MSLYIFGVSIVILMMIFLLIFSERSNIVHWVKNYLKQRALGEDYWDYYFHYRYSRINPPSAGWRILKGKKALIDYDEKKVYITSKRKFGDEIRELLHLTPENAGNFFELHSGLLRLRPGMECFLSAGNVRELITITSLEVLLRDKQGALFGLKLHKGKFMRLVPEELSDLYVRSGIRTYKALTYDKRSIKEDFGIYVSNEGIVRVPTSGFDKQSLRLVEVLYQTKQAFSALITLMIYKEERMVCSSQVFHCKLEGGRIYISRASVEPSSRLSVIRSAREFVKTPHNEDIWDLLPNGADPKYQSSTLFVDANDQVFCYTNNIWERQTNIGSLRDYPNMLLEYTMFKQVSSL